MILVGSRKEPWQRGNRKCKGPGAGAGVFKEEEARCLGQVSKREGRGKGVREEQCVCGHLHQTQRGFVSGRLLEMGSLWRVWGWFCFVFSRM